MIKIFGSCFTLFVLIMSMLSTPSAYSKITDEEEEQRAAVIVGVLRFTIWPKSTEQTQIDLCLAGKPLSSNHLLRLNGEKTKIKGLDILVRKVLKPADLKSCNALILGKKLRKKAIANLMDHAHTQPIITLCDGCSRARIPNATIYLSPAKTRINFEVDWEKAKKNGIIFDPSLLELASDQGQN